MPRSLSRSVLGIAACLLSIGTPAARAADNPADTLAKVYGEWRIAVKPDKGADYDQLIETEGLPLFRKAGGRMVGWWKTLIGNLYEQVTIWEYDDMAAFEKAVGFLGGSAEFAAFVAKRDPLLSGEENRFLKPAAGSPTHPLPAPGKFVIHEVHRVPLIHQPAFVDWLATTGIKLLEKHGIHPIGPFTTAVGRWGEVTLLFRFESLAERDRLISRFMASPEGAKYDSTLKHWNPDVTTRLLLPAPFAQPPALEQPAVKGKPASAIPGSPLLPHLEQVAPRVFAAGFADQHRSANCGFFAARNYSVLVDLPRGVAVPEFVKEVERLTGKAPRRLILTHGQPNDAPIIADLLISGVREIVATPATRDEIMNPLPAESRIPMRICHLPTDLGDESIPVRFLPADGSAAAGCASVELPADGVLFAGPLVVNGPRARLAGSDSALWVEELKSLENHLLKRVVPGFGSWAAGDPIVRQRRFLEELRSQVAYAIALGKPPESLEKQVRISSDFQVWMPYDNPVADDLLYVYRELTVPNAPFSGKPPRPDDRQVHALVLIGDGPHEPAHLEAGLAPAFAAAGVVPHYTVDVRALTAENLAHVKLLVVLRDGLMRPTDDPKSFYCWVTREHEQAVVQFVEQGGGFLNLHNSLGLYPENGAYLNLAGGKYIGHGPLERFRVEAVDRDHPITRGTVPFTVADEQHTPVVDATRVRLLFKSRSDGGVTGDAGWVREPGSGRLCHLACGHTREALLNPVYRQILANAMLWCAKREPL